MEQKESVHFAHIQFFILRAEQKNAWRATYVTVVFICVSFVWFLVFRSLFIMLYLLFVHIAQGVNQGVAFLYDFWYFAGPETGFHKQRGKTRTNYTKN